MYYRLRGGGDAIKREAKYWVLDFEMAVKRAPRAIT